MKKYKVLFIFICFFCVQLNVKAENITKAYVTAGSLALNRNPKTGDVLIGIPYKTILTLYDTNTYGNDGCKGSWYKVTYNDITGYACGSFLTTYKSVVNTDTVREPVDDYDRLLQTAGFPSSYWDGLKELHNKYPTWTFTPMKTGLDFELAIEQESAVGNSYTNSKNQGYYSTDGGSYNWLEDVFYIQEGGAWYAANKDVVAYYMDPRNSFNEVRLFQFEELYYTNNYITKNTIDAVFGGRFSYLNPYSEAFVQAGESIKVNSVYLAALARQELGGDSNVAVSGGNFCYPDANSKYPSEKGNCYSSYYNFFNIGAGRDAQPVYNSLIYAKNHNWSTPLLAIQGGASAIANGYILAGQSTSYTKRYNVGPNASSNVFAHQYQTNVMAAYSESSMQYYAYKDSNMTVDGVEVSMLNLPFNFSIPVYENMPAKTEMPNPGNPNNHVNNITINDVTITNFSHDNYNYTYYIADTLPSVTIGATPINSGATVAGCGMVTITGDQTPVTITVTAQNGETQNYIINLVKSSSVLLTPSEIVQNISVKSDGAIMYGLSLGMTTGTLSNMVNKISPTATTTITKNDGSPKTTDVLSTGDKVNITNNGSTVSYEIMVRGDINGDGVITIGDLLRIQKYLLGEVQMEGTYNKSGDVNQDGAVNIVDLLRVQKYLLGIVAIDQ